MRAVVESGGFQYKVTEQQTICVPKVDAEIGQVLELGNVLMIYDENDVLVGTPHVEGASVEGEVLSHGKRPKVVVYKYKSKKNYRRKRGHRQDFTELLITRIAKPGTPAAVPEAGLEGIAAEEKVEVVTEAAAKEKSREPAPRRRKRLLRRRKEPRDSKR